MKNVTRFPHLVHSPLLKSLPLSFCQNFLNQCLATANDGQRVVLRQGEPTDCMYLVAHGEVEITCTNAKGHSVLLHIAGQGDIFGEVEVLSDKPCAATCTAAANSTLLAAPRALLLGAVRTDGFLRNLMAIFHDRLERESATKFTDQFSPLDERLRVCLYRLSAHRGVIAKTQTDIAGYLGCARQTLNRELGRLRARGLIQVEKGRIRVLDRKALIADGD